MKISEAISLLDNRFEARLLLSFVTGHPVEYLIGHMFDELSEESLIQFQALCIRRKNHEPIAYIIGKKEFYSREFIVNTNVLIPRSDSEVLIDAVLKENYDKPKILELGVGSGCLLLTLLSEIKGSSGVGVDISNDALNVAQQNVESLKLSDSCHLFYSDWFDNIDGTFDIIISNPPYIEQDEITLMSQETILYEPKDALFGGLEPYIHISKNAKSYLNLDGQIYLEIGYNQVEKVTKIFTSEGYNLSHICYDIENRPRVMVFNLDK